LPLLTEWHRFTRLVILVAIIYGLANVFLALFFFYGALNAQHLNLNLLKGDESDLVGALSAFITVIFLSAGAYYYWIDEHSEGYKLLEAGMLVEIFVGQIILFFKSSDIAIVSLFVTLFLLGNLKLLSAEETHKRVRSKKLVS
jgi:hypothetical protein